MILMLAPAGNMTFSGSPSGITYQTDCNRQVKVENNSAADQAFLQGLGCFTLNPFGGWGTFGFQTVAALYAADAGSLLPNVIGFPQYTVVSIFSDGTNTGTWAKTSAGTGAGNWTQVSNVTLAAAITSATSATASATAASASALAAVQAAGVAESTTAPNYATTAAGLAATPSGQFFAVNAGSSTVSIYLNSAGTAVLQRTLATTNALALTTGAALVGADDSSSGSVYTTLQGFLAKLKSSVGATLVSWASGLTGAISRTVAAKLGDMVSVKDFGAVGDGNTDDTTALQAAITYATGAGCELYFPAGTYKISSALTIIASYNWKFRGAARGAVSISQATANTPIFKLTANLTWGWCIEDVTFTWASAQPATNTSAVAIWMSGGTSGGGYWDWQVRRCNFANGFRAISGPIGIQSPIWGFKVSDCVFEGSMTGAAVYASPSPAIGQPRILIDNCEFDCGSMTEAAVQISSADTVVLMGLEFLSPNLGTCTPVNISGCLAVTMINCRCEQATVASGQVQVFNFPSTQAHVINAACVGTTGNGNVIVLQALSGTLSADGIYITSALTSGHILPFYASNLVTVANVTGSGTGYTDDIRSVLGAVAVPKYYADSQTIDAITTNGDASVTLTNTSDRVQLFNTTLTANRSCTLPSTGMIKGGFFEIVRRAATPGAFTLTVVDPVSGQNYVFAASTNGSVRYRWNGSWVLMAVSN